MKIRKSFKEAWLTNRFQDLLALKAQNPSAYPLLDFGVGEEKERPDPRLISAIEIAMTEPKNHKYADRGLKMFKEEASKYLQRNFNVAVSESEIAITMGTKEGLFLLPHLFCDPQDIVVSTTPGYIVLERSAELLGAQIIRLPLVSEHHFLPDLSTVKEELWQQCKILILNYPNNPTGAVATRAFYEQAIALAQRYDFLIVNDAAYLAFSDHPLAFLSIPGAKEVGVEFYTLSKSHNMTGFRLGFVAGNQKVIALLEAMMENADSGQYLPIQYAGLYALRHDEITKRLFARYRIRMENIVDILHLHHFSVTISPGTFYLYVSVPSTFDSAQAFSKCLLEKCGIMTIPYDEAGSYVRWSMTFEAHHDLSLYLDLDKRLCLIDAQCFPH